MKNTGELPKYYVEDFHEGIISKETRKMVDEIFDSKNTCILAPKSYDFKGIVFCDNCGCRYVRKKNYKKYVWKCNIYCNGGKGKCDSKQVPDSVLRKFAEEFEKEILKIRVCAGNKLVFMFADNTEKEVMWEMPSRKWTEEMKAEQYENLRRGRIQ